MSIARSFNKAAAKRGRDEWEDVADDVDELQLELEAKEFELEAKEIEIQKLRKENKELKKLIKGGEDTAVELTAENLQKQADILLKAIKKNIEGQMVYKNGMKRKAIEISSVANRLHIIDEDSGKRAAADFPGVNLEVLKAMLGTDNCSKASNGSKQFTVKLENDALHDLPGMDYKSFTKPLRYGSRLQLEEGLKFVYNKAESQLRIRGMFKMF